MSGWFSKSKPQGHGALIEDYAVIGDCQTGALVSREGSIDWLCWPSFSSGACFAALLGTKENGYWQICPKEEVRSVTRRYVPGTLILETTFVTDDGEVLLTDFMPPRGSHSDVIRTVRGIRGKVKLHMELMLRFDYGLTIPWVTRREQDLVAIAGPNMVVLRTECSRGVKVQLRGEDLSTVSDFSLREGDEATFAMTYAGSIEDLPPPIKMSEERQSTVEFWCQWSDRSNYKGNHTEAVMSSLRVLKAMTYQPTGGMVAAITTGLPEQIGGERNWDYRYCWLRDTSLTLLMLMLAGYTEEAVQWRAWLLRAIAGAPDQVQSLYGIGGERKLLESDLGWLQGYEGSLPVRIGNAASEQFQLDSYGEVAAALERVPEAAEEFRASTWALQAALVDHVCHIWNLPDEGIWETRGGRKQFVHSKVMAWVALDRAVRHHERYDGKSDVKRWRKNRDLLHAEICKKGFNKKLNSFTQSYGSKALDASLLRMVFVGFLPLDDPRLIGTVDAIEKHLVVDGLVRRYDAEVSPDGLKGSEGAFLACSFWLVSCQWLLGRKKEATQLFERLLALRNDVGLLSEEYDPKAKRMLGNFPQALSHIALVHAAFTLSDQWKPQATDKK